MTHTHTETCPIEHGTYRCYVDHGCRRAECREAWRAYQADRNRRIAYGRTRADHYVSGSRARAHLELLRHAGLGIKEISRVSTVALVTIRRILDGHRTRASTQDKLLAVRPRPETLEAAPAGKLISGAGTRRRLRALTVNGWTAVRLAQRLGCSSENVRQALRKAEDEPTTVEFARTVTVLYEQLWDQAPPCGSRYEQAQAARVRRDAQERGWAPPMAWDEESIDDLEASPAAWQAPSDLGAGRRRIHLDNLEDCASWGYGIQGAADRLGVTPAAVEACATRADRPDILAKLRSNAAERAA